MIPRPGDALNAIAMRLLTHIAPEAGSQFAQADAALLNGLLQTLSQDYERAVANRLLDIDELRELFEGCDKAPGAAERAAFSTETPASYLLADVTALHATGFELLIELHAWAEEHDRTVDRAVWALLRRHSERNRFEMPGL